MDPFYRKYVAPLFILIGAAVTAGVLIASRPDLPGRPEQIPAPRVRVQTANPGPVQIHIRSQGTVIPRRQVSLSAELGGRIVWVAPEFLTGGLVAAGKPLLRIDPINYQLAVAEAKADIAAAELSLAEAKVLRKKAATEQARASLAAAKERLRKASADLEKTEISPPFDAVIDVRDVDLGQFVGPGTRLMRLFGTDIAEIRLPVLPADVPFLRYGEQPDGTWPKARLSARFGETLMTWEARLARLEQRVDSSTRVYYLVAEVPSPYGQSSGQLPLAAGLFVEAEFYGIAIADAVRLPRAALHKDSSVYVVEAETLRRRPVRVVRAERDSIIVDDGLGAGDQVLVEQRDLLLDGMRVRVASSDSTNKR